MNNSDRAGDGPNAQQVPPPDNLTHEELKAQAIAKGITADYRSCRAIAGADGQITFMTYGRTRSESDLRADLARVELRERQRRSILRKPLTWFEDLISLAARWTLLRAKRWGEKRRAAQVR
ncbi:MAG TPA: hypothetical protein PLL01_01240 [Rhodoferax sp.]|nr:hypothetical protein [Rhodoferax sp.]